MKTGPDGVFTLRFVRPGEHLIQVAPFWLLADQAPAGSSKTVTVGSDEVTSGVALKAAPEQ